ncbi:hypothetical protein L249_0890, partial [Ophiocordyceps polyrhachis-furcata BCC 54312]
NYARIASNEEDIRRIAATDTLDERLRNYNAKRPETYKQGYKEAVKFFPEEKRPTSPERIYKKSFNKANKKTIAPNLDKLYSLTNRERNRYALGFYSRLIVTAGVQGQDIEASLDAEDRDIAINIISGIPILIDRKAPRKRLSSRQLTFVVDLTLNFGRIRVNYEAFTDKVMPAAISLFDTPKIMQDLPRIQVRVGSLKSPIMLALLDTSAETNILTANAACDLNLECRPI